LLKKTATDDTPISNTLAQIYFRWSVIQNTEKPQFTGARHIQQIRL
jgi:hypothetical protein